MGMIDQLLASSGETMTKRSNSGPQGKRARAKWEAHRQGSGGFEPLPDATGTVLEAGWETFFTTLNVRLERGLEWRGGAAKLTFAPAFWASDWEKVIDVRPRLAHGTPPEEAQRWQFEWVRLAGGYVQYQMRSALLIAGEPWPGRFHVTPILPANTPAGRAPASAATLVHRETAFGVAPGSGRLWLVFGESSEAIAAALEQAVRAGQPTRAPLLPLDLPWQVIGGQMQFPFSGEDPRIADARIGIFFSVGGLTEAEVAAEDTPLTRAFHAARSRMRELGHEMDVGSGA